MIISQKIIKNRNEKRNSLYDLISILSVLLTWKKGNKLAKVTQTFKNLKKKKLAD